MIPALLSIYNTYLTYRAANGGIPETWEEVSAKLNLPGFIGDALAVQAARALSVQREGLGAGADELWAAVPAGVSAGTAAGLRTIAEALIWTNLHDLQTTKDEEGGLVPTLENPPLELQDLVLQSVSAAAQTATAEAAGWRYKTWRTRRDSHVRDTHRELEGVKISLGESFHTRDGDTLLYPGDPAADIGNRIGCFIDETRVSAPDVTAVIRAPWVGDMVRVQTRSGRILTGTPNHPMLTDQGWVSLGKLNVGDHLVSTAFRDIFPLGWEPDVQDLPPQLGEVFSTLNVPGNAVRVPRLSVDFYGDRPAGDVDVVPTSGVLNLESKTSLMKQIRQQNLMRTSPSVNLPTDCGSTKSPRSIRFDLPSFSEMRSSSKLLSLLRGHPLHPDGVRFSDSSSSDISLQETSSDNETRDVEPLGDALLRLTTEISLDDVIDIQWDTWRHQGSVFTLSTGSGLYLASGLVTHNCRCYITTSR